MSFATPHAELEYKFDPQQFKFKKLLESEKKTVDLLEFKRVKQSNIVVAIRDLKDDENSAEKRRKKVLEDESREIIATKQESFGEHALQQWMYIKNDRITVIREVICGPQIVQFSFDLKLKDMAQFAKNFNAYKKMFENFQARCL